MAEFALIDRLKLRARSRPDVVLGIGDDAALLDPPAGHSLVLTVDTMVEGVHFAPGASPAALGWKVLAVNLSDLAAMGATPAAALLALTLPNDDSAFVDDFATSFAALADAHRVALVGGDTTRGPLAASVTALGYVPHGQALLRSGARAGDDVWVTGTLGDAAGALAIPLGATPATAALRERLDRPTPRVGAGLALRGLASACIDISDGFLADLGHVLAASGVGAEIRAEALPGSPALAAACPDAALRLGLQLSGGDDYELCFCAPASVRDAVGAALAAAATPAVRVGRIVPGAGVTLLDGAGQTLPLPARRGYVHFAGGSA